jgi:hypothetical protein
MGVLDGKVARVMGAFWRTEITNSDGCRVRGND